MKRNLPFPGSGLFAILALFLAAQPVYAGESVPADDQETFESMDSEPDGDLDDEFDFLEDSGVVELAARHKQEIGMSPSAITVITREDIATFGSTSITDLLRMVPGMEVVITSRAVPAITSRLYYSNEGNHYLVLVDGRDANFELLGLPLWEQQPIFVEDIERIEIIRGPGSALYGANAMAGVVNITTSPIRDEPSAWSRVSFGPVGTMSAGAGASARIGDWGFFLGGGVDHGADFYRPREPSKQNWKFRAQLEYRLSETSKLLLDGGVSNLYGFMTTSVGTLEGGLHQRTLRLAYQSESIRSHLFWTWVPTEANLNFPLEYAGILLAEFPRLDMGGHVIDGDVQWTLPTFWKPLLLMAGANSRASFIESEQLLDPETYTDPNSDRYHQPGVSHREMRAGAFVHAEIAPADWITVTGSLRFDYNTVTDFFVSPRAAAVFRVADGQFLRVGVARAFRKPSFMETHAHIKVDFPETSPITGTDRQAFQEFMTRVIGNSDLDNEKLLTFETGYLGQFLEGKLNVTVDLYYNRLSDLAEIGGHIVPGNQGLPDLEESTFLFANSEDLVEIYGAELLLRYSFSEYLSVMATYTYRQINQANNNSPKNLAGIGGRFRTDGGLLGSLFLFTRSEFTDTAVENPAGIMEPVLQQKQPNVGVIFARLGYTARWERGFELESGVLVFLPVDFSGPTLSFYEKAGGTTPDGKHYGGDHLTRLVSLYLKGSF